MGGAIGTSVFITMALWLPRGGPLGLFLGYFIWSCVVFRINECFSEMTCYAPVPSCFITFTSYWLDEAFAFAQAWAFFLAQALLVPAEITAFHVLITFWTDKIPVEATVIVVLAAYAVLNCFGVIWFGKVSFCSTKCACNCAYRMRADRLSFARLRQNFISLLAKSG